MAHGNPVCRAGGGGVPSPGRAAGRPLAFPPCCTRSAPCLPAVYWRRRLCWWSRCSPCCGGGGWLGSRCGRAGTRHGCGAAPWPTRCRAPPPGGCVPVAGRRADTHARRADDAVAAACPSPAAAAGRRSRAAVHRRHDRPDARRAALGARRRQADASTLVVIERLAGRRASAPSTRACRRWCCSTPRATGSGAAPTASPPASRDTRTLAAGAAGGRSRWSGTG